jgi:N-acetylmuramic acid 6-phosphate etherase
MTKPDLTRLLTEARNPRGRDLDRLPTLALLQALNDEDLGVASAVRKALPRVAAAVEGIAARLQQSGRLIYAGAGSSGRLGVLDAAECGPTFGATAGQVVGLIAGGPAALAAASEAAEDSDAQGAADLRSLQPGPADAVVGIAASGRTPWVLGALREARARGAFTAAVVCNPGSPLAAAAEVAIEVLVGPELLAGSTRLKAGTATKLVLNMLSTGAFVRLNKTYAGLMVDLQAGNEKLRQRCIGIVMDATGNDRASCEAMLLLCNWSVKGAIVALRRQIEPQAAWALLLRCEGNVRAALDAGA